MQVVSTGDIKSVVVSTSGGAANAYVFDNLFASTAVPEPATLALLAVRVLPSDTRH